MTGVAQLGYLGFEVSDLDAWETFATRVLGVEVVGRTDSGLSLRLDSYEHRVMLAKGPADDLSVLGWQVEDDAAMDEIADRLRRAGVEVTEGSQAECEQRRVARLVRYADPAGNPSELFHGPALSDTPFQSKLVGAGFVAEDQGLGHLVITTNSRQEALSFYSEVLGMRLSDHIRCDLYGFKVDLSFLHANARHHSLAFGDQQEKRLHHFMLQVGSIDDVGMCMDRALRAGVKIAQTLGRHPNDRMLSFYAHTPSGFQFEYGWGAREVDDATWNAETHDCVSEWGHHPPLALAPKRKRTD